MSRRGRAALGLWYLGALALTDEEGPTTNRWKPGASDRERSPREHGKWVSRPHGLRASETRASDRHDWQTKEEREK